MNVVHGLLFALWTMPFTSSAQGGGCSNHSSEFIKANIFEKNNGILYSQFITRFQAYKLHHTMNINILSRSSSSSDTTELCIGFYNITSVTRKDGTTNNVLATVKMEMDSQIFTGVIAVKTQCFLNISSSPCPVQFFPMKGVKAIPTFAYSPLTSQFWSENKNKNMSSTNWIKGLSVVVSQETIPSNWIADLQINSLENLKIGGNYWSRPENLLGPLPRLKTLDLSDNNIEVLPDDTFSHTPELTSLVLSENNMTEFPKALNTLRKLKYLEITNGTADNELVISDSQLLSVQHVNVVKFEYVKLHVNVSALLNLQNLTFINVSGCGIHGDIAIRDSTQKRLHVLDMSWNNITKIYRTTFSQFKLLQQVHLQCNEIQICESYTFNNLTVLKHLDLSHNFISEVSSLCFNKLPKLMSLNLSNNHISQLPYDVFQQLTALRVLDVSHNKLTTLPTSIFYSFTKLNTLDLSHNSLTSEIYLKNVSIHHLNLSYNRLSNITFMTHYEAEIEYVDMSWNMISVWEVSSVKHANLSYNHLTNMNEEMSKYFNNMKSIDLGGNSFNCCSPETDTLKAWIEYTPVIIKNLGKRIPLYCHYPNIQEISNYNSNLNKCDKMAALNSPSESQGPYFIACVALLGVILTLILFIVYLLGQYRKHDSPKNPNPSLHYVRNLAFQYDETTNHSNEV